MSLSQNQRITKDTDIPVTQSKLKVSACSWRKARENEYEQVMIGCYFWLAKKVARISQANHVAQ